MPTPETVAAFTTAAFFVRYYNRPHQQAQRAPHMADLRLAAIQVLSEMDDPEAALRTIVDALRP
jgi:hypothetical protein